MPCIPGRSTHILCKPDCKPNNMSNTPFSVMEYCLYDDEDNIQKTIQQIREEICLVINLRFNNMDEYVTTDSLNDDLELLTFPQYRVPVNIYLQFSNLTPILLATIQNGNVIRPENTVLSPPGTFFFIVDDKVCGQSISTPA